MLINGSIKERMEISDVAPRCQGGCHEMNSARYMQASFLKNLVLKVPEPIQNQPRIFFDDAAARQQGMKVR